MVQTLGTGQNRHRPGMGVVTGDSHLATGALPIEHSGLSYPAGHFGNHAVGLNEISARGSVTALFPALGDGVELAQPQNHSPNGSVELQEPPELGTGDSHALSSP